MDISDLLNQYSLSSIQDVKKIKFSHNRSLSIFSSEWIVGSSDDFSNINSHSSNCYPPSTLTIK